MTNPLDKALDRLAERFAEEMAGVRADFAAGLAQTSNANRLRGARAIPLQALTSGRLLWGGGGRLMGWTVRNANGSGTITADLRDGHDNSGDLLGTISLGSASAWQQQHVWLGSSGVSIGEALFLDVAAATGGGSLTGAVYLGAVD